MSGRRSWKRCPGGIAHFDWAVAEIIADKGIDAVDLPACECEVATAARTLADKRGLTVSAISDLLRVRITIVRAWLEFSDMRQAAS